MRPSEAFSTGFACIAGKASRRQRIDTASIDVLGLELLKLLATSDTPFSELLSKRTLARLLVNAYYTTVGTVWLTKP